MAIYHTERLVFIQLIHKGKNFKNRDKLKIGDLISVKGSIEELVTEIIPTNDLRTIKGVEDNGQIKVVESHYVPIKSLVPGPQINYFFDVSCLLENFAGITRDIPGLYRKMDENKLDIDPKKFLSYQNINRTKLRKVGFKI